MKKTALRIASISLAAVIGIGGASIGLYANNKTNLTTTTDANASLEEIVTASAVARETNSSPNETVYIITDTDGTVTKVFDNEYVKDSNVPVNVKITYTLDGKEISASELAGKSGKVSIRFDYENLSYENMVVNDVTEKIYVPFTMVSGVMLNDKNFTNIEIKNGKLIDDGNRTIALGIAFPGLKDNLKLADYDYDIEVPDYVEITADVTDFALDMSLTIATNEVFSELKNDNIENVDELKESLDKLNDATAELIDGTATLYEGLDTLYSKIGELTSGVNDLNDGSKKLMDGALELSSGAAQLAGGASELSSGLSTLASNNDALNSGATQVFNTLLATASTQLKAAGLNYDLTIENYNEVLDAILASFNDTIYNQAHDKVVSEVNKNEAAIVAGVTAKVKEQVTANVTAQVKAGVEEKVRAEVLAGAGINEEIYASLDEESKAAIDETIASYVEAQMTTAEIQAMINTNVNGYMATEEASALIANNVAVYKEQLIADGMNSEEVQNAMSQAASGLETLTGLKASLNSYNQFYVGLQTYTAGVAKAASGASQLASGAGTLSTGATALYNGTVELYNGTTKLNNAMPALTEGVEALRDGSKKLNEGMIQYNEEGIEKINNVIHDDIETLINRFKATVDASKNYRAANGTDENSSIKFIYRSEAVK